MRLRFALPQVGSAAGPEGLLATAKRAEDLFEGIKEAARQAGRDPSALELIVRGNVEIHDAAVRNDRVDFTGSLEQIAEARKIGAAELVMDAKIIRSLDAGRKLLPRMEELWRIAKPA